MCACAMLMTSDKLVGKYHVLSLGSVIVASSALYWTIFIVSVVILGFLTCFKRSYPINYFLLSLWTIAMSVSVATACVCVLCDPMVQVRTIMHFQSFCVYSRTTAVYHGLNLKRLLRAADSWRRGPVFPRSVAVAPVPGYGALRRRHGAGEENPCFLSQSENRPTRSRLTRNRLTRKRR